MLNRRHGPLALVLVLYALLALVEWKMVLARTDGRYIYSLDDTYIHMSSRFGIRPPARIALLDRRK